MADLIAGLKLTKLLPQILEKYDYNIDNEQLQLASNLIRDYILELEQRNTLYSNTLASTIKQIIKNHCDEELDRYWRDNKYSNNREELQRTMNSKFQKLLDYIIKK